MPNLVGRGGLAENRLGPNYISNRALKKQEQWLDKVSNNSQKQLGREEAKMRKSLERLRAVKSNTRFKILFKGSTPVPSHTHTGGHRADDCDNISNKPSHHKPSRSNFHDSHSRHTQSGHHPDAQPSSQYVRSKMKIDDRGHHESLPTQRSGRMHHTSQHPNQHDRTVLSNPAVPHLNIQHGSGHHQDKHNDGSGTSIKLTLPQIQNLNEAMGHLHVPMTTITVVDCDPDDHVGSPGSHSRISKNNASSMRNIYDEAIQKISSFHAPSPRYSENNSTSSIQSESRRHRNAKEKLPEIDKHAFRDLENIVKDAKLRKKEVGATNYASRHNRRRLQHLEQLLEELRPRVKGDIPFDPADILECRYLRLTKTNIEHLENMLREKGVDPGIHAHTDVSNYNLWS